MTEPKSQYKFVGAEFKDEVLEISPNYHAWVNSHGKVAPIYLEVIDGDNDTSSSNGIGISVEDARRIIEALTEIVKYLEEKND